MRTWQFTTLALIAAALLFDAQRVQATFPGQNGKIAFVGNQSGTWELYTMDADGGNQTRLTNLAATNWKAWLPTFSPDGHKILFSHDSPQNPCPVGIYPPNGCINVYVINVDGTNLIQLTTDGLSWAGSWSPDGSSIVFDHIDRLTNTNVVTIMKADGTGVGAGLTNRLWLSDFPRFSPSGRHLEFDSQNLGLVSAIWTMDITGANQSIHTPAALEGGGGDFSPDGRHVVFNNHNNTSLPNTSLFVLDTEGQEIVRLTDPPNSSIDLWATYSPDGKHIVFASTRLSSDLSLDIFTMNVDGTNIQRIASGVTVGGCPDGNCVNPNWGAKPSN